MTADGSEKLNTDKSTIYWHRYGPALRIWQEQIYRQQRKLCCGWYAVSGPV